MARAFRFDPDIHGGLRATAVALGAALCLLVGSPPARPQAQTGAGTVDVRQAQALARTVYALLRGRRAPEAEGVGWSAHFYKGQDGRVYVPFTVSVHRSRIPSPTVALYVLVTSKEAASGPPVEVTQVLEPEAAHITGLPAIVFESVYFVDVGTAGAGDTHRISRALSLPAGDYDVHVALSATPASDAASRAEDGHEGKSIAAFSAKVSVPDLWTSGLATSSVVVAERVEPLAAPLTAERQEADPYALGTVRIVPLGEARFRSSGELSVIFFVYNAGLTRDRTPDLTVEYRFYRREGAGEQYFNRTSPQQFNAQTLPGFEPDAGHQIIAGQSVPLGIFPAGDYRLEIGVKDNTSGSTVVRNIQFAVL